VQRIAQAARAAQGRMAGRRQLGSGPLGRQDAHPPVDRRGNARYARGGDPL
jgi:hypothetical protein